MWSISMINFLSIFRIFCIISLSFMIPPKTKQHELSPARKNKFIGAVIAGKRIAKAARFFDIKDLTARSIWKKWVLPRISHALAVLRSFQAVTSACLLELLRRNDGHHLESWETSWAFRLEIQLCAPSLLKLATSVAIESSLTRRAESSLLNYDSSISEASPSCNSLNSRVRCQAKFSFPSASEPVKMSRPQTESGSAESACRAVRT